VFFRSVAHFPLSLCPASTAPKHSRGRFLPLPAPSHSYSLRPIRGRDRIPINLVSAMSSDPFAPLPSSPSAPSLSQASVSLPLAAVPSTVPSTGYVPPGTSSVPLTLDSFAEVVREISRNMAVMQGNMIAMQVNVSSIHTYITGAQNPPLPASTPMPLPPSPSAPSPTASLPTSAAAASSMAGVALGVPLHLMQWPRSPSQVPSYVLQPPIYSTPATITSSVVQSEAPHAPASGGSSTEASRESSSMNPRPRQPPPGSSSPLLAWAIARRHRLPLATTRLTSPPMMAASTP
jgi:hypothetical protein